MLVSIIGKAGSGKDSILRSLISDYPELFNEVVSYTSRPPREGEIDGLNYHFITREEFERMIKAGEFFEYTEFNGWYYGTGVKSLGQTKGKVDVAVLNPAGVRQVAQRSVWQNIYYITASDKTRMLRQLNREENPNCAEIARRFQTDEADFVDLPAGSRIFVNETPQDFAHIIASIVDDCKNLGYRKV